MMTRDEFIVSFLEQEVNRLFELSEQRLNEKPKRGCEKEWHECSERLVLLEQMINEIPMDVIIDGNETGEIKQEFIGELQDEIEVYYDCSDFNNKCYFIKMTIKNCGDEETYKDERLLKISETIWLEWFNEQKYKEDKQLRKEDKLETYIKAIVVNNEIQSLQWV